MLHPTEPDPFLLQPQARSQAVVAQVVKQRALLCRQPWQIARERLRLFAPVIGVGQQRVAVHQQGLNMGQRGAQLVEDGETMRVNVAPVMHGAAVQPLGTCQHLKAIASTKYQHAARDWT